jgi:hypothetical protein
MPKKIVLKNNKKQRSVTDFIASLPTEMKDEAKDLLNVFKKATGVRPKLWGNSMIGFGEYDYKRSNGDYGTYFATGFAIRKSGPTIYIMPGYNDYTDVLKKLGPHKLGKSCVYLKSLADINQKVLAQLIKAGIRDLKKTHTVRL